MNFHYTCERIYDHESDGEEEAIVDGSPWPTSRRMEEIQEYGTAITIGLGISTVSLTMASNRLYHLLYTFWSMDIILGYPPSLLSPCPRRCPPRPGLQHCRQPKYLAPPGGVRYVRFFPFQGCQFRGASECSRPPQISALCLRLRLG